MELRLVVELSSIEEDDEGEGSAGDGHYAAKDVVGDVDDAGGGVRSEGD